VVGRGSASYYLVMISELTALGKLLLDAFESIRKVVSDRNGRGLVSPRVLLEMHRRVEVLRDAIHQMSTALASSEGVASVAVTRREVESGIRRLLAMAQIASTPLLKVYAPDLVSTFDDAECLDNEVVLGALSTISATLVVDGGVFDVPLEYLDGYLDRSMRFEAINPVAALSNLEQENALAEIARLDVALHRLSDAIARFLKENWSPKDLV